ncbi:MAG: sortase [Thermoleophilia bacterium]
MSTARRCPSPLLIMLAAIAVALVAVASASAAEPPDQRDPCASGGRNTCGTTGVGTYERYRYGLRWFGDFRGAVDGERQTFCIDLRFWYPGKSYRYRQISLDGGLKNRAGRTVSVQAQRRMAYALWNYGRSNRVSQQAAMMLYVHSLMGDGAPGEVDPSALGSGVQALFTKISRESARYAGPYRLDVKLPGALTVGNRATGTVRLIAASGAAVPNVVVNLTSTGASGIPARVRTDSKGVATLSFTPNASDGVSVEARTEDVASTLPKIYSPTSPKPARNGQRLAAPDSQRLSATAGKVSSKATISVSTVAYPTNVRVGQASRDRVRISGLPPGRRTTVTSLLYGPFRSPSEFRCEGEPAVRSTFTATKSGTYGTPVARLEKPGWYTYQVVIAGDDALTPVTTPCGVPAESFRVQSQPAVTTKVSSQQVKPGDAITDTVIVSGLHGEAATVNAWLFGPFPSREAIRCDVPPIWTGSVQANGDGEYLTAPFQITTAGYYTYRESIDASDFVRATETACGDAAETTVAMGSPTIRTQVSAQSTKPGDQITDAALVQGLGALTATVNVELWGPYNSPAEITCTGTPYWTGTFTANGDGLYNTAPVTLDRAGYYTYRESIAPSESTAGVQTACGEAAETTITRAAPAVSTKVLREVQKPRRQIADRITLTGLGKTPVGVQAELFGPFATRAAIRCTGTPVWRGSFAAQGDGTVQTEGHTLAKVGFYTYRVSTSGSDLVPATVSECGLPEETVLVAPTINTGRAPVAASSGQREQQAGKSRPTRVRIARLGINAPVAPVGIDTAKGQLDVPPNIQRLGWWRDGAAPGAPAGATLIAGHVDSARAGEGAFFKLKSATSRDRVQVTTADGRTRTYRVTSVRRVKKDALPDDIYSLNGRERLVLVTCGGRFDQSIGHYVDNIVVTAVPVR